MSKTSPISDLDEFNGVIAIIKEQLKRKKITYGEFANQLGISESGLKKIFAAGDCSYLRLKSMLNFLELDIKDVLAEVKEPQSKETRFSMRQQEYFLENPDSFLFFFKLCIERKALESVTQEMKLTKASQFSHLKALDDLGILRLGPGDKIKLPPLDRIRSFGEGPLIDKIYSESSHKAVSRLANAKSQKEGKFIIRCLQLRRDTYEELMEKLKDLDLEILAKGVRELSFSSEKELTPFTWLSFLDNKSLLDQSDF